jgi:hypothetical protein
MREYNHQGSDATQSIQRFETLADGWVQLMCDFVRQIIRAGSVLGNFSKRHDSLPILYGKTVEMLQHVVDTPPKKSY